MDSKEWIEDYKNGMGYRKLAKKYGVNIRTMESRVSRYKKNNPETRSEFDEQVQKEKEKCVLRNEKLKIETAIREASMKDIIVDKMVSAIKILPERDIQPIHFTPARRYSPMEAVLMLSDIQSGTYIKKETTGGLNAYDSEVRKRQFDNLEHAITSIVTRHKQIEPINVLNVHCLGDLVEGMGIFEGQAQHVDQDLYDQVFELADDISALLQKMLYLFDKVVIKCVPGNHGRIGKKGENPHWVNWDLILMKYVEAKLQNFKKIVFDVAISWWLIDEIQGHKFLLLHGDDIRAWNGLPFYGIKRADANWTLMLQSVNKEYEYMELGHFHDMANLPRPKGEILINGSWIGGSMFSMKNMMTTSQPCQLLFGVHPEKGISWRYPIWLNM